MTDFLTNTLQSVLLRPQRSIGELRADVVVEETHEDSITRTEHPVESGTPISDHAYVNAPVVVIRGGVSDSGVLNFGVHPSTEFYEKLLELQQSLEPFDLITGKRAYKDMMLDRLSIVTDVDNETVLSFTAECGQVTIVQTQVVEVPPSSVHADPARTSGTTDKGQRQTQEKPKSVLRVILGER